jgi:HK97 family phage portal protein
VGILDRFARWLAPARPDVRASLANPPEWLVRQFGGRLSATGVMVDADSAMRVTAVYACVRVLAESVASLPFCIYRRLANGKEIAKDHPLYPLLHDMPNEIMTSFEFREAGMAAVALRGNAYTRVVRDNGGRVREMVPLPLAYTKPRIASDRRTLLFDVEWPDQAKETLTLGECWHVKGMTLDGIIGVSAIAYAREAIGLALALEEHGARLFSNGARPQGIITLPGSLTQEQVNDNRTAWSDAYGGLQNAHKTAVLQGEIKYQPLTMTSEDAQFIEARKFQASEIARMFRVPPHMIGDLEKATFSNIEHQAIEFVKYTLRPWLIRWEQAANRDLLTESEREEYFIEFNPEGLLRGDIASRYQAYAIAIQNGIRNRAEIRETENLDPGPPELAEFLQPVNMGVVGEQPPAASGAPTPTAGSGTTPDPANGRYE